MSKNDAATEEMIQAKGLNAPRLTPADIAAVIVDEAYHVFEGSTLTVCMLTLKNGFNVTGESAAASPENFDEEIGRKIARENAVNKIWMLEGYLLRERLHTGEITAPVPEKKIKYCGFDMGMSPEDPLNQRVDYKITFDDGSETTVAKYLDSTDASPAYMVNMAIGRTLDQFKKILGV